MKVNKVKLPYMVKIMNMGNEDMPFYVTFNRTVIFNSLSTGDLDTLFFNFQRVKGQVDLVLPFKRLPRRFCWSTTPKALSLMSQLLC